MIKSYQLLFKMNFNDYPELEGLIESGNYGIEINDFSNPEVICDKTVYVRKLLDYKKIIERYSARNITLHGAFIGLQIHSKDTDLAKLSRLKIIESLQAASELKARKVVFHSGIIPQAFGHILDRVADVQFEFWTKLLEKFKGIEICIENVWEKDSRFFELLLPKINNERFTMCLDYGHIGVFADTNFAEWVNKLSKHLSHIHLHDNDGKTDLHQGLGEGKLAFFEEVNALWDVNDKLTYTLEVGKLSVKNSIQYMIDKNIMEL